MQFILENNPPSNSSSPMPVKSLVPTPKCLANLQKISEQQTHLNQLDRYFLSEVQAMKEKGYPLQGILTLSPGKKIQILKKNL